MVRPTTLPPDWAAIAEKLGGVTQLAAEMGVTTMTIWRWANGERPVKGPARIVLVALCKRLQLKVPE